MSIPSASGAAGSPGTGGAVSSTSRAPARPHSISDERVPEVIEHTLSQKPRAATHWSIRSMAQETGLSHTTIRGIWNAFALQPHRAKTFKLSPIRGSWTRCVTSSDCICRRWTGRSSCAWTGKIRFKFSAANNPCSRGCRAFRIGARTTICAMARRHCSPRSTSPRASASANATSASGPAGPRIPGLSQKDRCPRPRRTMTPILSPSDGPNRPKRSSPASDDSAIASTPR